MPLKNIKVTPGTHLIKDNEMVEHAEWKIENKTAVNPISDPSGRGSSESSTLSVNQDICR